MARIRVIIVNYNSGTYLKECLAALLAQSFADFEAVVFDNASTDGALDRFPEDSRLTLVRHPENIGFAAANNRAAQGAETEWLAMLNPDAIPEPDWLEQFFKAATQKPDVDFWGSTQLDAQNPEKYDGVGDQYFCTGLVYRGGHGQAAQKPYPSGEVFAPCAAAAFYRTARFHRLGGFAEDFFCYLEDVDLAFRHRLAGGQCRQAAGAVVRHYGSAITGRHSAFSLYHGTRNMVWCFWRNMPQPLFGLLLPFHFIMYDVWWLRHSRRGQGRVVFDAFRDALSALPRIRAQRRVLQKTRLVPWWKIAAALTWNPLKALLRSRR